MYVKEGVVQIKPLTSLDEGYYQCKASNQHGTALSNVTVLQRAVLQSYGLAAIEEKYGLVEGAPFKLNYVATKCMPRPAFTWGIANEIVDKSQVVIVTDQRVQIDEDGTYDGRQRAFASRSSMEFFFSLAYGVCTVDKYILGLVHWTR
jgi:hypothetical protein